MSVSVNFFQSFKNRLKVYVGILVCIGMYLIYIIDSKYLHNGKKIYYSLEHRIELADFEKVISAVEPDNALKAGLEVRNDSLFFKMEGFENELIAQSNRQILKRNKLHPTQSLALSSLGFASDFFVNNYKEQSLTSDNIKILEQVYFFVFQGIINPFSLNTNVVNDHAISERIQFIVLFRSYLEANYPEKKKLISALSKDFNICLSYLLDNKSFTWQTNHGIMQLRSIAQVAAVVKSNDEKNNILKVFDDRLLDIIPYYIGEDGAVYEAASGYWRYIYSQLKKISDLENVQSLKSIKILKKKLGDVRFFIESVASNDGFAQGMGDSYSYYFKTGKIGKNSKANRSFLFSNQLCGANWTVDNVNYNILFASLYTPPNIHKLPEDLSFYLYINAPYFMNTGMYSYNQSDERIFFTSSEKAHSTVYFSSIQHNACDSSRIFARNFGISDTQVAGFTGIKYYGGDIKITRDIDLNENREILVKDYSNTKDSIITQFNIAPGVKIRKLNSNVLQLTNKETIPIIMESNSDINIVEGIVSDKPQSLIKITQLQIKSDTVLTHIKVPAIPNSLHNITQENKISSRYEKSIQLEAKYKNQRNLNFRKVISKQVLYSVIFLLTLVISVELRMRRQKPY